MKYVIHPLRQWRSEVVSLVLLGISCVFAIFTDSNNVPLATIIHPLFFLAAVCGTSSNRFVWLYVLPISCCRTVGGMHMLGYLITFMIVVFIWSMVMCGALVQKNIWMKLTLSTRWWSPMALPTILTAIFQLIFRFTPIGAGGNPAMSFGFEPTFRQSASLFGEIGVVFLIGWIATVGAGLFVGRIRRSHIIILGSVLTILLFHGGLRVGSGKGMYLSSIEQWPLAVTTPLHSSCITQSLDVEDTMADMIRRTNERLAEGDDLIVWSEGSVYEHVSPDSFIWPNSTNPGAVVAVAFIEYEEKLNQWYNSVELYQNGKSLGRYDKNQPVPVMENHVIPGSNPPKSVEVTFTPQKSNSRERVNLKLRVTTAICFDFDFPFVIRLAHDADLAIGPSWYWDSIGQIYWSDNIFRAIENGFTLFKCAADGISGAVDPYGRTIAAKPTLQNVTYTAEVPVQPGVKTLYADGGGFLFGYLCCAICPIFFIIAFLLPTATANDDKNSNMKNEELPAEEPPTYDEDDSSLHQDQNKDHSLVREKDKVIMSKEAP